MTTPARWVRRAAMVLGAGAAAGTAAAAVGGRRWHGETQRLLGRLAESSGEAPRVVSFESLAALPPPVQRYFRRVLKDGQPFIAKAFITQQGEFRRRESVDPEAGWQPFTARQVFATSPPGFVWDARIRMGPFGSVWVRDGYVADRASMLGAVMGTFRVVDEPDGPDLRAGSLQRYLAEAVWFPTMLLPEAGVGWSPIDETHARASLTQGGTTVTLDFEFSADGRILSSSTVRRRADRVNKGRYFTLPWGGRYRRYQEHSGMMVPVESEVYWIVSGREQPYYRGRNVRFEYHFR